MMSQSRVKGIVISYITTIVRTLSKLLLTPLYLKVLGLDGYGFYQYVFSIASYATILDFGISSVINTFSIKHRENNDNDGVENVMFYSLMFTFGAVALIAIAGAVVTICAPTIFGTAAVGREELTRKLLVLIISELVLLMLQHFFEGVMLSEEKYVTLRSVALVQILFRCIITILLLYSDIGVMSIALGDFFGVLICLAFEVFYCKIKLNLKIKYHYKDIELLRGIIKLACALCLQSVVSFLNSSIDKYVLGRMLTTAAVSIYSVALTFSTFFDEIPTVIQRLYLPQVVKLVTSGASGEKMTDFVIKPGRYQFMLCGGVLGGFILYGRQFIALWSGEETIEAWAIALLLMVPSVLPLIQNVCLSILTAMNKRMFRSYVLCGIALLNLLLTIFLVKKFGLMGAPVGTFIALVLGNNLAMNWYYKNKIGINVKRLFLSIFKGILPCFLAATALCFPITLIKLNGWLWLISQCIVFIVVYAVLLWLFGINAVEKSQIREKLKIKN